MQLSGLHLNNDSGKLKSDLATAGRLKGLLQQEADRESPVREKEIDEI